MEKLDFPNRITVELTNRCNVSCSFCPRQDVPMEIGYMDMDLYQKIIDEAAQHLPVKLVLFFRGESLLHPQFLQCLAYAKQRGIGPIQFASNALALDEQTAEKMLEIGIDFISFSLDTLNPQVYRATRKHGDLHASMEHVIALSEKCRQRRARGLSAPVLQVSTIELEDYVKEQQDFIAFWQQYVDIVRVYYEHDEKGGFRNEKVSRQLAYTGERRPCRKVFTDFLVYWNGDLALCNYDWKGGLEGLNLKALSIHEAWHSERYERIRRMQNENVFEESLMCKKCQHWRIDYMPQGFLGKMYKGAEHEKG